MNDVLSPAYAKPLPAVSDLTRPFWEAAKRNELRLQRCAECGHTRYPIAEICPRCLSGEASWEAMSGRGTVFSHVVFHQVYNKAFADDAPYNVVLVQLDEGPRMFSNVVDASTREARVGDRLEVVFEDVTPEIALPRFRLAGT